MLTDSYDIQTKPIISPADFYGPQGRFCDVCIATFSKVIFQNVLQNYDCEKVAEIGACNGNLPLYVIPWQGRRIGFYLSSIGSTAAATDVIEANWLLGAAKFILFGSAGSLNQQATRGNYVVPTAAYRDEGISYHYAPPADYIQMPGAAKVADLFRRRKVPYVLGKTWTTDAIYRETRGQMEKRVSEGCIAVEMELAGVQAVCDFHGWELYGFLVTGDVLDQPEYSVADLSQANHSLEKFYLALELAME